MKDCKDILEVKIFRFNPAVDQEPQYKIYRVPFIEGSTVSNLLQYINEEYDGGLAHYLSCRRGICSECMVRVDGKPVLACKTIVSKDLTIDPVNQDRVVKDLVMKRIVKSGKNNGKKKK